MVDDNDFTAHLRDLDNDQLIQTEAAVKECMDVLYNDYDIRMIHVRIEAEASAYSVQREFLRRAKFGTHVPRKRTTTT
jgi:hypothetical protein